MDIPRKDVVEALCQKGFKENKSAKGHDHYRYYDLNDRKTSVRTMVSRGTKYKTLGNDLRSEMARQCKLSKKQFEQLVSCDLTRQSYEEILRSKQLISP